MKKMALCIFLFVLTAGVIAGEKSPQRIACPRLELFDGRRDFDEYFTGRQDYLSHELFRQALLLTAQRYFDVEAGDESLGFSIAGAEICAVTVNVFPKKSVQVSIRLNQRELAKEYPVTGEGVELFPELAAAAYAMTKSELPKFLNDCGLARKDAGHPARDAISERTEKFMQYNDPLGQTAALNSLNRDVSSAKLTERQLITRMKIHLNLYYFLRYTLRPVETVFLARALLDLEELCEVAENDKDKKLHRIYAYTFSGMERLARRIADRSDIRATDADWLMVLKPYLDRNASAFEKAPDSMEKYILGFRLNHMEIGKTPPLYFLNRLRDCPYDFNVRQAIVAYEDVSAGHGAVRDWDSVVRKYLAEVLGTRDVPEAFGELAKIRLDVKNPVDWTAEFVASARNLAASGRVELGANFVADIVAETATVCAIDAIAHQIMPYAVDPSETAREASKLKNLHPAGVLLDAMQYYRKDIWKARSIAGDLKPFPLSSSSPRFIQMLNKLQMSVIQNVFTGRAIRGNRYLSFCEKENLSMTDEADLPGAAWRILDADDRSVRAIAILIRHGRLDELYKKHPEFHEIFADESIVNGALCTFYYDLMGDTVAALKYGLKTLNTYPCHHAAFRTVSKIYLRDDDREKWLKVQNDCLTHPSSDSGLRRASQARDMSKIFMQWGDRENAVKYAEMAAESWAEWAMLNCAEIQANVGDKKRAALWAQRTVERYGSYWSAIMLALDHDLEESCLLEVCSQYRTKLLDDRQKSWLTWYQLAALSEIAGKDPAEVTGCYQKSQSGALAKLFSGLYLLREGDTEAAAKLLGEAATVDAAYFEIFCRTFDEWVRRENKIPSDRELQALMVKLSFCEKMMGKNGMFTYSLPGFYLYSTGDREHAKKYLVRALGHDKDAPPGAGLLVKYFLRQIRATENMPTDEVDSRP